MSEEKSLAAAGPSGDESHEANAVYDEASLTSEKPVQNAEKALGEVIDKTPEQFTPQDFDMVAFAQGMRPYQRSIKLFLQGDLVARLDEIAQRIDEAPEDANVDYLIEEFERVKREFQTGTWFTVEQRSQEWIDKFRARTRKSLGYKGNKSDAQEFQVSLHQMVEQIVIPSNLTVENLNSINSSNEAEFVKLLVTVQEVNSRLAQSALVLTRDFSRRRSTPTAT